MADEQKNTTGTELEILQNIERAFKRANPNTVKRHTAASLDWFRKYIPRAYNRVRMPQVLRDRDMWKNKMQIGKMYLFEYDPKHKDTLPLWDRYPLVFPFSTYRAKDGALIVTGLNMHYLSPKLRMIAFAALLKLRSEKRYRKSTRLAMEWDMLKSMGESRFFKHAVHSYRMDHVKSVFVEVPSASWELMLFLPTERFVKGSKQQAWKM